MTGTWRPTVRDLVEAAAVILDTDPETIERLPGLGLAESALEAPFACGSRLTVRPVAYEA